MSVTTTTDGRALLREVLAAGSCSHPIRLTGRIVNMATGELKDSSLRVPCKDRRVAICPACSYLYKADAWILISAGIVGGKGLPTSIGDHPRLFVTLTAPSFGAVHRHNTTGRCNRRRPTAAERCRHGRATLCQSTHDDTDLLLGQPICGKCFDYRGAVLWNAAASKLWNATIIRLRQSIATAAGLTTSRANEIARINYLKVAEVQRRGLIHFHVIIRADGPEGPEDTPPAWLTPELLGDNLRSVIRSASVEGPDGTRVRWGTQFDIADVSSEIGSGHKVASYLAKYSTKTTDGSVTLARAFSSRRQIEKARLDEHTRLLALTAWDLDRMYSDLRLRHHAHTFGFRGQLITKSMGFSTTFGQLRGARTEFMKAQSSSDPVAGTFHYAGRGYSDPRGEQVAHLLHGLHLEQRKEAALSRSRSRPSSRGGSQ